MAQATLIRNQEKDHLLTPRNSVMVLIDYQPEQFRTVFSKNREEMLLNVIALGKIAKAFDLPTILSTVGVEKGVNQGTIPELRESLAGIEEIDRLTLNSWEDADFIQAVKGTGRRKIIMAGLWTEVCVAYPTLDALQDGYEVYPVTDAIGGVSEESHEMAMQRMIQAGARPVTALALACELQRDWARNNGDALRKITRWYFSELFQLKQSQAINRPEHRPAEPDSLHA